MTAYAATVNGYTIGDEQEWEWTSNPSLDLGTYRGVRQEVPGRHGVIPAGTDLAGAAIITWTLEHMSSALESAEAERVASRLRAAWAPGGDVELTLTMQSGSYALFGRTMAPQVVTDEFGNGVAQVQFERSDPLLYGANPSTASVSVGTMTGGMATPMVTPMVTSGSGSSGDAAVSNSGTAPTRRWSISVGNVTTAIVTPRFMLNGQTIQLDGTIPVGGLAVIDGWRGRVTLDGQPRPWPTFSSDWWAIPAGASTFSFRAASGDGVATLTWRDASY